MVEKKPEGRLAEVEEGVRPRRVGRSEAARIVGFAFRTSDMVFC